MFSRKTRISIPFNGRYILKWSLQLVRTNYSANSLVQFSMSIVCENNGEQFAIPVNILLNPNIINMVKCPDIYLCDDACMFVFVPFYVGVTSNEQCPFVDHTNNRIFTSYMYNWNQQRVFFELFFI